MRHTGKTDHRHTTTCPLSRSLTAPTSRINPRPTLRGLMLRGIHYSRNVHHTQWSTALPVLVFGVFSFRKTLCSTFSSLFLAVSSGCPPPVVGGAGKGYGVAVRSGDSRLSVLIVRCATQPGQPSLNNGSTELRSKQITDAHVMVTRSPAIIGVRRETVLPSKTYKISGLGDR